MPLFNLIPNPKIINSYKIYSKEFHKSFFHGYVFYYFYCLSSLANMHIKHKIINAYR